MGVRMLHLEVITTTLLPQAGRAEIVALCDRAYGSPAAPYFEADVQSAV